jgi:lipopolysaccharide biosynthesis protein
MIKRLLYRLTQIGARLGYFSLLALGRVRIAFFPERMHVRSARPGQQSLRDAKKVAILVTYDRKSRLHDYVVYYLAALKAAGFAVVLVSNSRKLTPEAFAAAAPHTALIVHRRNRGYDFGAYRDGIALLGDVRALDSLVLTNDSIYGPFSDLQQAVFSRMDPAAADVWSLTDSWDRHFHLQSFFLHFTKHALSSPAWRRFWRNYFHVSNRKVVIERYEIGLTKKLMQYGLRCKALTDSRGLLSQAHADIESLGDLEKLPISALRRATLRTIHHATENGAPLNVTHYCWDKLLISGGFPFIKRDLLLHNPEGVLVAGHWDRLLRAHFTYDPELILAHLRTVSSNRSP